MNPIPYGRQDISQQDIQAVTEVLCSDWLTQGPVIDRFERAVADYCGAKYAVAVNSATSALHIACMAADLGPGDLLWTSPNTFVASANCALYCGASVDFVDIDPCTYNMSPQVFSDKLEQARAQGKTPKVVIPVHFTGQSCEMEAISRVAKQAGIIIIEDASHAVGGSYKNAKVGSCQYSDMAVFSFHPVKIVTTAEGGMILTNRKDLYDRLVLLRSHGITRDPQLMVGESHGPWYYQQVDLGYNYRMTDVLAALGYSQLTRIDTFVKRRHELAKRYDALLQDLPLTLPYQHPDNYSAYHLYVICLQLDKVCKTRKEVFLTLREAGLGVNVHYIPVHTQPYYQRLGFQTGDFPAAERYYEAAISIPMYFGLTDEQQDYVVQTIRKALHG